MCYLKRLTHSCLIYFLLYSLSFQCSKCKEYFIGEPTKGHHCYRQMTVDKEYCFDPDTQTNCNQNPGALLKGRTVFFAVQPRYLNVDIRITIDVTLGGKLLCRFYAGCSFGRGCYVETTMSGFFKSFYFYNCCILIIFQLQMCIFRLVRRLLQSMLRRVQANI